MPGQYSIPPDNPFAGDTPGADEIYSYGLRNPYRFSFDRLTGDLTIGDVGQSRREEINFMLERQRAWRQLRMELLRGESALLRGGCFLHTASPEPHTAGARVPAPASGPVAVNGGYVIRDGALPSLLGRYVYADTYNVFGGELRTAQLFAGGSSGDSGLGVVATTVVSFGEDACGHIYVATIGGVVYRLEPASGPVPCTPPPPGTLAAAHDRLPSRWNPAHLQGDPGDDRRHVP